MTTKAHFPFNRIKKNTYLHKLVLRVTHRHQHPALFQLSCQQNKETVLPGCSRKMPEC